MWAQNSRFYFRILQNWWKIVHAKCNLPEAILPEVWLALQLPFFSFFLSLLTRFCTDCLKVFSKHFIINYQGRMWPRSDSFLGHTKKSFRKNCSSSCYSRRVWHMARLKHGNQHSQHPKKRKKQPETRKQVSQWMAKDWRVKIEINRVDK